MKEKLSKVIADAVNDLTGYTPKSKDQAVKQLRGFITQQGGADFIVDEDLETLFRLAEAFSDDAVSEAVYDALSFESKLHFKRIGRKLDMANEDDHELMQTLIVDQVSSHFPYLRVIMSKGSVSFIDKTNAVLTISEIMRVEEIRNVVSFMVYLPRIHDQFTLEQYVDPKYLGEPFNWVFKDEKQKRCEGRYIPSIHLMDLLSNKEILALENNVKFKNTPRG